MAAKGKGSNVGNVYVTVVPTMRGFAKEMNRQLSGVNVTQTGRKIGESLGGSIVTSLSDKLVSGGKALQGFGRSLADVGGKLTTGLTLPLATATAGVGAFALSTASAAETTEISFTTMLGSAEAARDMMDELSDFAAHTPFELSGLQTATRQLLAYGFTAEDVIPMLTAVGDATAALGTGQAGIESVTRALGQMQTRGKVSAEEMLQLTEAGIPAWEYLAEAIGTDTAGAMQAVTDGAVSASQGIQAITQGMERDFGGMMESQSKTVAGLMSNLADAIQQPLMELRDTDAYADFADALEDVVDAAGPFVESLLPHLEDGLSVVSDVLEGAADAMESFADMGEEGQSQLIGLVTQAALAGPALTVMGRGIQGVGTLMRGAGGAIKTGTTLVGKLSDGLLDLATSPKTAETALGKFAGTLSGIPGPAALAAAVIGGVLVSGIVDFVSWSTKAEREAQVQADAMDVLRSATRVAGEEMVDASDGPRTLGTEIYNLGENIQENWQSIADLGDAFSEIDREASASISQLSDARQAVADYAGQTDLSTQELGSLRAAIETLNDQCGTNYEVVKDAGGAYQVMSDGAAVAKDEIYKLIDAQIEQARVSALTDKLESIYAEQAEQAEEYATALSQVSEAQQAYDDAVAKYGEQGSNLALDDLNEARDNLAEVERQMEVTGDAAEQLETAIGNASAGGAQSFDALVEGSGALRTFFGETGGDAQEFADDLEASGASLEALSALSDTELAQLASTWDGTTESIVTALARQSDAGDAYSSALVQKLEEAGVATETLSSVGSANIAKLAQSFDGNIDTMVWALDNYNNVPIINKDGTVRIEDSQLIDAQGRVAVWNGTDLVYQDTGVRVEDGELRDAQGRIYTWNGSSLIWQSTGVSVDTGQMDNAWAKWKTMDFAWKRTGVTAGVYTNNVPAPYATGGIRTHADGGVIATKAVPLDIVGEDGAEAIVPLTNRRYSQPFVDLIAEGVTRKYDNAEVVAAINALRRDISEVGVYLDSGRLVGGISRDMNRTLGRIQKRGSLA